MFIVCCVLAFARAPTCVCVCACVYVVNRLNLVRNTYLRGYIRYREQINLCRLSAKLFVSNMKFLIHVLITNAYHVTSMCHAVFVQSAVFVLLMLCVVSHIGDFACIAHLMTGFLCPEQYRRGNESATDFFPSSSFKTPS